MLVQLQVQQNELVHIARFDRPLLELWGEGRAIVEGLFSAFSVFGINLADIRNESSSLNPADQVVAVNIGLSGVHRFRFDRIESVFFNFDDDFLRTVPSVLDASTNWVRKAAASAKFISHQFTYSSHSVVAGKAADKLLTFVERPVRAGGQNTGTGAIFHWDLAEKGWATKLLLDRSITIPDGVFVMFTLTVKTDRPNYASLIGEGKSYLDTVLKELGFELT